LANLCDIWLAGDHYKWRAMRANGVAERFCTGDASPFEKLSRVGGVLFPAPCEIPSFTGRILS